MAVDTFIAQSLVGPQGPSVDGTLPQYLRIGARGEQIVGQCHAPHFEAASRGRLFTASNQAEVTWGTSLTATAVTFTLYNPTGSGVNLVLLQCSITQRTGSTPGHLVYAANVNTAAAAPATNTALTVQNCKLGGGAGLGLAYSITTLPAAPVAIRSLCGVLTAVGCPQVIDYVDGAIILQPNTAVTVQGITAVGTGIVSMVWEEVPY